MWLSLLKNIISISKILERYQKQALLEFLCQNQRLVLSRASAYFDIISQRMFRLCMNVLMPAMNFEHQLDLHKFENKGTWISHPASLEF